MELMQAVLKRRAIRAYKPDAVPSQAIENMRTALHAAPTGQNLQAFHFYFVTDAEKRKEIAQKACHQPFIEDAPLLIVAASQKGEGYNTGIAMENVLLSATADGLGSCFIGWFEREPVHKILNIPGTMEISIMAAAGYANETPAPKDKKTIEEISTVV